jgi:hypothetical protein
MNKYLVYLGFGVVVAFVVAGSLWCTSCRDWFQTKPVETVSGSGDWQDKIKITSLTPGEAVSSPLVIKGEARGTWFFEASFPVILVDWDGKIITQAPATAAGEWMTEEYVPFTATLNFTKPTYNPRGALIFKKDNPSGLPQYEAALEVPIKFK